MSIEKVARGHHKSKRRKQGEKKSCKREQTRKKELEKKEGWYEQQTETHYDNNKNRENPI